MDLQNSIRELTSEEVLDVSGAGFVDYIKGLSIGIGGHSITVGEIASGAGSAASTIYHWFHGMSAD